MADLKNLLKTERINNTDKISITHNANSRYVRARLLVDAKDESNLITSAKADPLDPNNKIIIKLDSVQTGVIQVLSTEEIDTKHPEEYGSFFVNSYSEAISSNTGTEYANKLVLETGDLPMGSYLITWNYFWNHSSTSSSFKARLLFDDVVKASHVEQPSTSSKHEDDDNDEDESGDTQKIPAYGMSHVVLTEQDSHTITLQFGSSKAGRTSKIWNAHIIIRKVPS